jgi:hypothetical protein
MSHNAGASFDATKFQPLPALPVIGGVSVRRPSKFTTTPVEMSYGIEFDNVEDIYALTLGYGKWLESQGFVFDEYNKDLTEILNWEFSSKEMLYWTTQKWAVGSVITLSPFANSLRFEDSTAIVDSLTNAFYDYSILKADGAVISSKNISTSRDGSPQGNIVNSPVIETLGTSSCRVITYAYGSYNYGDHIINGVNIFGN